MDNANAIVLGLIGVIGAQSAGVIYVVKYLLKDASKDLKEHTKAAIQQADSNKKVGEFIASSEKYLRDRNGRDAEQHVENMNAQKKLTEAVNNLPKVMKNIADATQKEIKEQKIESQNVEHQEVHETVRK